MEPYTKLLKRIIDWDYFGDAHALQLLIYLMSTVNYEPGFWNGIRVKVGQKVTSIVKLADACQCSKNTIVRALKVLVDSGTIVVESDAKKTIITLKNYTKYQCNNKGTISKIDTLTDTPTDTLNGTLTDTLTDHNIRNKEYKEEKNSSNNPHTPLKGEGDKTTPKFNASDFIKNEPEETRRILQTWIDFKKKQFNEAYKTEVGFKAFITKLNRLSGNDPEKAAAIIEQSMANNWKGIYELKNTNSNGNNKIDFDRICELSDAMLNYERQ